MIKLSIEIKKKYARFQILFPFSFSNSFILNILSPVSIYNAFSSCSPIAHRARFLIQNLLHKISAVLTIAQRQVATLHSEIILQILLELTIPPETDMNSNRSSSPHTSFNTPVNSDYPISLQLQLHLFKVLLEAVHRRMRTCSCPCSFHLSLLLTQKNSSR